MKILSHSQKYSVEEIATELGFSTKLENGIRNNFGDPISINELKLITRRDFTACKYFGMKSWRQFKESISALYPSKRAVTFIKQSSMNSVIVEIDTSKPFRDVILGLATILKNSS